MITSISQVVIGVGGVDSSGSERWILLDSSGSGPSSLKAISVSSSLIAMMF